MKRGDLAELHYITPIDNVPSIRQHGILSHKRAKAIEHETIAMQEIQDRRRKVRVPGGHALHEYANLYMCARNPMLYRRQADHKRLCVLRISTSVLDLSGVVVADRNASSDHVRFGAAPGTIEIVNGDLVFADYWTHPEDRIEEWRHKSIKCAEVLVPDRLDWKYVFGAHVSCEQSRTALVRLAPGLDVLVSAHLFFQ